jgi:hypothetical protein
MSVDGIQIWVVGVADTKLFNAATRSPAINNRNNVFMVSPFYDVLNNARCKAPYLGF